MNKDNTRKSAEALVKTVAGMSPNNSGDVTGIATTSEVNTALAQKASTTDVNNALAEKADAETTYSKENVNNLVNEQKLRIDGLEGRVAELEEYKTQNDTVYSKTITSNLGGPLTVTRKGNQVSIVSYGSEVTPANNGSTLVTDVGIGYRSLNSMQVGNGTTNTGKDFRAYGILDTGEIRQYQVGTGTMLTRLYVTYITNDPFPEGDEI